MDEQDFKEMDRRKIEDFLAGKNAVAIDDIIAQSGASRLRIYPVLFEMQQAGILKVLQNSDLGTPQMVALVDAAEKDIVITDELLDSLQMQARASERLRANYNLHDSLDSPVQRLLYALEIGTEFPIHRHKHASETYVILRGALDILFLDNYGTEIKRIHLSPTNGNYGCQIPKYQWHTLELQEPSVILLVKDGPYKPIGLEDML